MRARALPLRLWLLVGATLACTLVTCESRPTGEKLVQSAQFGVFYGGQVQERKEIPFELDRSKQEHGFRIDFTRPLARDLEVSWEINMPGSTRRVRDRRGRLGRGRLVKLGEAVVVAGRKRFDKLLPFEPGDPLGLWNIRVVVHEQVLIDRPFLVYDARARKRARRDAGTR
jgi:hypothetical protein